MKLSLSWLNDYIDLSGLSTEEIVDRLTLATCEVEGVEERFSFLEGVVAARVLSKERHPNADRLSVCKVDAGDKEPLSIVCGAPNVQADMWVPLARVGAKLPLPDGGTLKIKPAKLRGVESHGMLCAASELGLDELGIESEGLLALSEIVDEKELREGRPILELLPLRDTVLEIDNKSITHRPDLWCHFGFARELSAIFGLPIRFDPLAAYNDWDPEQAAPETKPANLIFDPKIKKKTIKIEKGSAHAYFGMPLEGLSLVSSPLLMRARLSAVGQRPINNVVDASNYVMFETGQPNHAFDGASLKANAVGVVRAKSGARLRTLDGEEREIPKGSVLIADGATAEARIVALAGVMGAENSEVRETTTRLFLESATFPRELIRPVVSATGLRTDSSQRFEKGQDPAKARPALLRLASLIAESLPETELRMGPITGEMIAPVRRNRIEVSLDFLQRRLGLPLTAKKVRGILESLGIELRLKKGKAGLFEVTVPSYRSWYDITIPEDLVEELGRIHGYDNIPARPPLVELASIPVSSERRLENSIKKYMSCRGFAEVYNYSFASEASNQDFGTDKRLSVELANPVFGDRPMLRRTLLAGLLEHAHLNQDRFDRVDLFELGRIYYKTPEMKQDGSVQDPGDLALERKMLAALSLLPHLPKKATETQQREHQFSAYQRLRSVLEGLLASVLPEDRIHWQKPSRNSESGSGQDLLAGLHPGCSAAVVLESPRTSGSKKPPVFLGRIGLLHPVMEKRYGLARGLVLMELDVTALVEQQEALPKKSGYHPPSVHPVSHFEISVLLDEASGSHVVADIIRGLGISEITEVRYLTEFRADSLPEGKRSVSYRLSCLKQDGSISQEELQSILDRVVSALKKAGIHLR